MRTTPLSLAKFVLRNLQLQLAFSFYDCSAKAMDLPEQPGFEMPVDVAVTNKDKENDGDRIAPALALNVDRRSCFF
jgi:hypothetical protein